MIQPVIDKHLAVIKGNKKNVFTDLDIKGTSRGLKELQSYMNDSYHKSALFALRPPTGVNYCVLDLRWWP